MEHPLKLRWVYAVRRRLADGTVRIHYRYRKNGEPGVMLGNHDDLNSVLQNYHRVARSVGSQQRAPSTVASSVPIAPRLVSAELAAAYCGVSVREFDRHFAPELHRHEIGRSVRYDLKEIGLLLDRISGLA